MEAAINLFADFDWLVFSSSNGVHYFMRRLLASGRDLRSLGGIQLATIGPATAEALAEYHLTADIQPEIYRAEVARGITRAKGQG